MGAGPPETLAYIHHPTPESHTAIEQAVSRALPGRGHIDLPLDAGTSDGAIVVTGGAISDTRGLALDSRDPGAPGREERFHLIKSGELCMLVHERTGRRYELISTTCEPR